jgi:hypothetical protein
MIFVKQIDINKVIKILNFCEGPIKEVNAGMKGEFNQKNEKL